MEQFAGKWKEDIPVEGFDSSISWRRFKLYKIPLCDFGVDDLRFMLLQQLGGEFLLPLAIALLQNDILTEGNYYPGDLLNSVLMLPKAFWQKHLTQYSKVCEILLNQSHRFNSLDLTLQVDRKLLKNRDEFLKVLL